MLLTYPQHRSAYTFWQTLFLWRAVHAATHQPLCIISQLHAAARRLWRLAATGLRPCRRRAHAFVVEVPWVWISTLFSWEVPFEPPLMPPRGQSVIGPTAPGAHRGAFAEIDMPAWVPSSVDRFFIARRLSLHSFQRPKAGGELGPGPRGRLPAAGCCLSRPRPTRRLILDEIRCRTACPHHNATRV